MRNGAPERLALGDLASARRSLARITRAAYRGEMDESKSRLMGYLFGQLLGYFKTEMETDIAKRLDEIEARQAARDGRPSPATASRPTYAPATAPDSVEPEDDEDAPTAAESAISETPATSTDWRTRL